MPAIRHCIFKWPSHWQSDNKPMGSGEATLMILNNHNEGKQWNGFFCYGIAWGINNGILNRERFLPVAKKAWTALASVVNEDGKVGWSQPAGGGPGKVAEADTSKFGTGIFLLAASEVFLLTQSPAASKPLGLRPMALPAESDVIVYGGTPGGITAAIAAARDGASVILLEQTRHVGRAQHERFEP